MDVLVLGDLREVCADFIILHFELAVLDSIVMNFQFSGEQEDFFLA